MLSRLICLGMVLCSALVGCETTAQRVGRDPLLLSKRGIEGSPANAAPSALLVSAEPLPPDLPATSLVSSSLSSRRPWQRRTRLGMLQRATKLETHEESLPTTTEKPSSVSRPQRRRHSL